MSARDSVGFDQSAFYKLVEGDRELAGTLLDLFAKDWPQLSDGIQKGVAGGDHQLVERQAHRLKGNLQNFFAQDLASLAEEIEVAAQKNRLDAAQLAFDKLHPQLAVLEYELQTYIESMNS